MFTTLVTPAFWTFVPLAYCSTHLEDAPGILHYQSGSEAYGRLDLTDKSPPSSRFPTLPAGGAGVCGRGEEPPLAARGGHATLRAVARVPRCGAALRQADALPSAGRGRAWPQARPGDVSRSVE